MSVSGLTNATGITGIPAPFSGLLAGTTARFTPGTLDNIKVRMTVNGTSVGTQSAGITAASKQAITMETTPVPINAGDIIGVNYTTTTTGTFTPGDATVTVLMALNVPPVDLSVLG